MSAGARASRARSPDHRRCVVKLALGTPLGDASVDWKGILDSAVYERCAALTWLKSAAVIRASAPVEVQQQWRAEALATAERARSQFAEVTDLLAGLEEKEVQAVVMKGQPLSQMLYGDPFVRPSFDIDLFIPPADRAAAHDALLARGWRHSEGAAPGESTYLRREVAHAGSLEVHSALLDDNLLSHLASPVPAVERLLVADRAILVHTGAELAIFLAVHLAKHGSAPLLWWIDFTTLWTSLSETDRAGARAAASALRLTPFLQWAERGAMLVEAACGPDGREACAALEELAAMHHGHNAVRVGALAPGIRERARVALAWLWPVQDRRHPGRYVASLLRRGWRFAARRVKRGHSPDVSPRDQSSGELARSGEVRRRLTVDHPEFAEIVRTVTAAGAGAWVRARGNSMLPAIPHDADVFIAPLPVGGPAVGDVVLAVRARGRPVLHRVVALRAGKVSLRGDNTLVLDPAVSSSMLLGIATKLRVGSMEIPVPGPRRFELRMAVRRARARLASR